MSNTEMIKRVAAPIHAALTWDTETAGPEDDSIASLAIAAIAAMRDPTDQMLEAAHMTWFHGTAENPNGSHSAPGAVRRHFTETWQAQIDAALGTKN